MSSKDSKRSLIWSHIKYLLMMTFENDSNYSIRFKISNNTSTIRFDPKWKNTTIRTPLQNTVSKFTNELEIRCS